MKRGSRAYGSLVMGSITLQIKESVVSFMNGSISAVSGSGITSMSLAWIGTQPRIEEPSNPRPSSNTPSVNSAIGMVKCCQRPRKSMNFRSTITACLSFANPITSLPFGMFAPVLRWTCDLQRRLAPFAGADADDLVDRRYENLSVPDPSGARGALDGFQRLGHQLVGEHHFDLHFWQEVDDVLC